MSLKLNKNKMLLAALVWLALFIMLSITGFNQFQILNFVTFPFLIFLPGTLSLLILRIKRFEAWINISLAIALSLLELMIIGLIGNTVLHTFGVARPLDQKYLLSEISIFVIILTALAWFRVQTTTIKIHRFLFFQNFRDAFFAFVAPFLLVLISIIGATYLNNGGSNGIILILLALIAGFSTIFYFKIDSLNENVAPTFFFLVSLSLLLMSSLRGWYITGHDIQIEYKVFQLAKTSGFWNMATYRDAYNACLSITILPTVFSNFLKTSDQYVYKFFFQIIFAVCASVMFLISRRWLSRKMSFLAGMYFISFPTFFEDMPFLVRQEIAFLFYGLMIYLIFKRNIPLQFRRILFMFFGLGVILSHYSTTYTILVIFGMSAISIPVLANIPLKLRNRLHFNSSTLDIFTRDAARISLKMVLGLFLLNFLWTTIITNTGGNVTKVLKTTISAIGDGFTENSRSIDAIGLITFNRPGQEQQMKDYIEHDENPIRKNAPPGVYYDQPDYTQYSYTPLKDEKLPATWIGGFEIFGKNSASIAILIGQLLARLMELTPLLGLVYVFFRRPSFIRHVDREYWILATYCVLFICLNIVLPVLSTEYGVFRALQQSMFALAPFLVIGAYVIAIAMISLLRKLPALNFQAIHDSSWVSNKSGLIALILTICFFLYSSAFIPQLLGENSPLLHLNNAGKYYDSFLMHKSELYGINWLNRTLKKHSGPFQPDLQADKFSQFKIISITNLGFAGTIFPSIIKKESYVFLNTANIKKNISTVLYNSDAITYKYPVEFLNLNKNLIYNSGGARVYK